MTWDQTVSDYEHKGDQIFQKNVRFNGPVNFLNSVGGSAHTRGKDFYVHSGTGSDGGAYGTDINKPFKTLDYALSRCEDSRGDTIHLQPGHGETVTGAGAITLDKIGVSIIGYGNGTLAPTFLIDGALASMLVTAANCAFIGSIFKAGHADLAYLALITADGFTFGYNTVKENIATENFKIGLSFGAADNDADNINVIGNKFQMADAANTNAILLNKNQDDVVINNNLIVGEFASGNAPIKAGNAEVITNLDISGNKIWNNVAAGATVGIDMQAATCTGICSDNFVSHKDTAGETPFLFGGGGVGCFNNFASGVPGTTSGYLLPVVDS
jgi:hypothetical protein